MALGNNFIFDLSEIDEQNILIESMFINRIYFIDAVDVLIELLIFYIVPADPIDVWSCKLSKVVFSY